MTTPNVTITFTGQGQQAIAVINQINRALQQLQRQQTGNVGQANQFAAALSGLRNQFLAVTAAIKGAEAFGAFIREGLRFNEVIEASTLGIASLITAQGELRNQNGDLLKGTQALAGAYELADDQINKLRIDGIRTAATTEQLVDAFQQAVGAGLSVGLGLDQIRSVTVQIVQAATALGVPLNQLNQEVRSILDATIDRNSRVAKALNISNAMVNNAREEGRLYQFLNEQFAAFTVAGERSLQTWKTMKSNIVEAFQAIAGASTEPLFTKLKEAANTALQGVFDFNTARIAKPFEGLVNILKDLFGRLGDVLSNAIIGAVNSAQALSQWFAENKEEVDALYDAIAAVGKQIMVLVGNAITLIAKITAFGVQTGLFAGALRTVEQLLKLINTTAGQVVATIALIGPPLLALTAATGPIGLLGIALAGLLVVFNAWEAKQDIAKAQAEALRLEYERQIGTTISLSAEYAKLARQIDSNTISEEERVRSLKRMDEISKTLIASDSRYATILHGQTQNFGETIRALKALAEARVKDAQAAFLQHEAQVQLLKDQRAELAARQITEGFSFTRQKLINQFDEGIRRVSEDSATLALRVQLARKALEDLNKAPPPILTARGRSKQETDAEKAKRLNDLKQDVEAEISRIKTTLKTVQDDLDGQLAEAKISYREYFEQLTGAQIAALQEEIEQRQRLVDGLTDKGEIAKAQAQIDNLVQEQRRVRAKNASEEIQKQRELMDQLLGVYSELLTAQGQTVAASALEIEKQYADLIRRLRAEGNTEGVKLIEQLIDAKRAEALMKQVETVIGKGDDRLQQSLANIQARVASGAVRDRDARKEIVKVYQDQIATLQRLKASYLALFAVSNDPAAVFAAKEIQQTIDKLEPELRAAVDATHELRRATSDAIKGDIVTFLSDTVDRVHSLSEAFRELFLSILNSLQQVAAQFIANELFETIGRALGFGIDTGAQKLAQAGFEVQKGGAAIAVGAAALLAAAAALRANSIINSATAGLQSLPGIFAFREGGGVPGYGRGDKVRAYLEPGEYVLNREVTAMIGKRELDQINFGRDVPRIRKRHYATGGMVEPERRQPAGAEGGTSRFEGRIGLEPGLIFRQMRTREGKRGMLRFMKDHHEEIQIALRLR